MASFPETPDIELLVRCPKPSCAGAMGELRPYLASQDSPQKCANRGRLCQTCKNRQCNMTVYHTVEAYDLTTAEVLVTRILARQQRRYPIFPSQVPDPAANHQPAPQSQFFARDPLPPASTAPPFVHQAVVLHTPPEPPSGRVIHGSGAILCAAGCLNAKGERKRGCKECVGAMLASRKEAVRKTEECKSLKEREEEMHRLEKTKVVLTIYYKTGTLPVRLSLPIDTWPKLQLNHFPDLMRDLELQDDSFIDFYHNAEWATIKPRTVIASLQKNSRLLFRLRRALLSPLSDEDCPGIDHEYAEQPGCKGKKRSASPIQSGGCSKAPRIAQSDTARTHAYGAQEPPATAALEPLSNLSLSFDDVPTTPLLRSPGLTVKPAPFPLGSPMNSLPTARRQESRLATKKKQSARRGDQFQKELARGNIKGFKAALIEGGKDKPRWPFNFYTCDVRNGLVELESQQARSLLQKDLFPAIFDGAKLVRGTFEEYKNFAQDAPPHILSQFVNYQQTEKGIFTHFLAALRKYEARRGRSSSSESDGSESGRETPTPTSFETVDPDADLSDSSDDDTSDGKRCPYCDGTMPSCWSPILHALHTKLIPITYADPTPSNRAHRRARTFTDHAEFCERHRFETIEVPKARANSWPEDIDFSNVEARVEDLRPELEAILECASESEFYEIACKARAPGTSKAGAGEYLTFTMLGAGYYGALGYHILMLVLRRMFPQRSLDPKIFSPLSWTTFIEQVMLSETAVLMIMHDLQLDREDATRTLRASRSFGQVQYPVDEGHPAVKALQPTVASPQVKVEHSDDCVLQGSSEIIDLTLSDDE